MLRVRISASDLFAIVSMALLIGISACATPAEAFDTADLAMWLDANDINGDGSSGNNPAYLSSVDTWVDKSGKGNNAFKAPAGDPPDGTDAGFPGANGGVTHAEILGPLPPAPVFVDHNDPMEERMLTPSGLPAVRFNTCNDAPQFPGCNVTPPTYPNQTGLMTNYHAHPDPTMVQYSLGKPAVPDLTVVAVVRPTFINDYHPIWTFDGNLGGHNRSFAAIHDIGDGRGGLWTDGGPRILFEDPLERWMIAVITYDYDGTEQDPGPKPHKLYINSPVPIEATGPESIQGLADAPMTIGWFPEGYTQGNNITMLLSEFIVFERTLSDADVNALGYELAQKYGISTAFMLAGVAGDYNENGIVDAADYVVWRKLLNTNTQLQNEGEGVTPGMVTQEDYDTWRANFGKTAGAGSALSVGTSVPEPAGYILIVFAAAVATFVRRGGRLPSTYFAIRAGGYS